MSVKRIIDFLKYFRTRKRKLRKIGGKIRYWQWNSPILIPTPKRKNGIRNEKKWGRISKLIYLLINLFYRNDNFTFNFFATAILTKMTTKNKRYLKRRRRRRKKPCGGSWILIRTLKWRTAVPTHPRIQMINRNANVAVTIRRRKRSKYIYIYIYTSYLSIFWFYKLANNIWHNLQTKTEAKTN